ncbi:hypothetical protein ACPOLB_00985 [Rubrivivax sp. RP6-9]|uniref:hypothetical protein n=1 Tax=Rubrivivax sp. RP6-9 TaxID=3415750 RepID=UPI003CC59658
MTLPNSGVMVARGAAVGVLLGLGCAAALAATTVPPPAPHQLWVSHLLAGCLAGLVAFVVSRWWALAGIVLVAAVWYALPKLTGLTVAPELLQQYGNTYPFHLQASALFVPLMVLAAIGARANMRLPGPQAQLQ